MASITTNTSHQEIVDTTMDAHIERAPLVIGSNDFTTVTDKICRINEQKPSFSWWIALLISGALLSMLGLLIGYLFLTGPGIWGNNQPVAWGFPITNFVFWVGIGHAGTLISAILYLFRQDWRTGINRFAEAMTIFAVICALVWPGIHIGRPWLPYWMFPYPNQMGMFPNFRSPLLWDVFAVGTYFTVSLLFWYMGMIPDLATLRDRSKTRIRKMVYGIFSIGWTGSNRHWHRYERAYLLLAALATPLVLSVHSVVSFDFAVAQLPGWHTTIFPPYFVAGAVFGGFAMVLCLAIPARVIIPGLSEIMTNRHMENMGKVMLATGCIVGYAYSTEFFIAYYSNNPYEGFTFENRMFGPYAWAFWTMTTCNVFLPQLLWFKKIRQNMGTLLMIAIVVNIGMWFERYVIIVTSLSRDAMPSAWHTFTATWVDICMLIGSFGLFFTLFFLFIRFLPVVAIAEVKAVMPQAHAHGHEDEEASTAQESQ